MKAIRAQHYVKPTAAAELAASIYLAFFFVVAALTQLFAFESYPDVIRSYGLPMVDELALPLAAVVVCLEVFAIPYLLWMRISRLMHLVSFTCGWLVLVYWLGVGVWQSLVDFHIANAGLFGAKLLLPQGWWLVSYIAVLMTLMAFVLWSSRSVVQRNSTSKKSSS